MVEVKAVVELSVACKADGALSGCAARNIRRVQTAIRPLVAADIEQVFALPLAASAGRAARRCEELSRPGSAGGVAPAWRAGAVGGELMLGASAYPA